MPKAFSGLAPAFEHLLLELVGAHDRAHAAAAAAPAGLEHEGVADGVGHAAHLVHVVGEDLGRGDDRHAGGDRHLARARLVAEHPHGLGGRADEGDAGRLAGVDEVGVLGEEAVAGVDGVGARHLRHADDLGDREVGGDRAEAFADAVGLVGLEAVQRELVLLGEDRDRPLAHLVRGAHDADGDLAAVGDQDLREGRHAALSPRLGPGEGYGQQCCVATMSRQRSDVGGPVRNRQGTSLALG